MFTKLFSYPNSFSDPKFFFQTLGLVLRLRVDFVLPLSQQQQQQEEEQQPTPKSISGENSRRLKFGRLLHQIKGGFTEQSQQSLQSQQSHPKPEAFDCLLELIPNIMIHY